MSYRIRQLKGIPYRHRFSALSLKRYLVLNEVREIVRKNRLGAVSQQSFEPTPEQLTRQRKLERELKRATTLRQRTEQRLSELRKEIALLSLHKKVS